MNVCRGPNAAITTDNVVTFGAGYHGACSGELTGCQAVPSQRAIGMGNIHGRSRLARRSSVRQAEEQIAAVHPDFDEAL
jgi:hypothetical protein